MTYQVTVGTDSFFSLDDEDILRQAFSKQDLIVVEESIAPVQEDIGGVEAVGWILLHFADAGMVTACELILKYGIDALKRLAHKPHQDNSSLLITVDTPDSSTTISVPPGQSAEVRVTVVKEMVEVLTTTGRMTTEQSVRPQFISTGNNANRAYWPGTDPYTDPDRVMNFDPVTKTFGPERLAD